ncbi:GntR family transcriptional regulator, partial [Acinetobacter baumannii]
MSAYTIIFAPIAQATRSEQVVERLENAIISGLLKSNEQLPNEADLARLMGVS